MTSAGLHVAIVTFGYPPIAHVSGVRPSAMARQLTLLGWHVTVVTVDWRPAEGARPDRSVEDGVQIVRVDPRQWHAGFQTNHPPFTTEAPPRGALHRRINTLRSTIVWGPYRQWAMRALEGLRALHAERRVDVVWAIHGDDSCHEVAARFHAATGVPWVADYKDAWNLYHRKWLWPPLWAATFRRLKTAAALTETSQGQAELDRQFGRPCHVVRSGYDAQMMSDAPVTRSSDAFTLAYFGNVSHQHDVARVARALSSWSSTCRETPRLELHVFGYEAARWQDELSRCGVAQLLEVHPFVEREEAFARMKGADVLVLLPAANFGQSRIAIGVKELEYVASGSPVLCFGRLIPELDAPFGHLAQILQAEAEPAATRFLAEEYGRFRSHEVSERRAIPNVPVVVPYAWSEQGRRLAEVLADAARSAPV